jgi:DNA topoisomerase-1
MSNVVIVESPAKCKTINKYLGKDYNVLASYGHIRDLPSKNGSVVPEEDFALKYYVPKNSSKHVKQISDAVKKSDCLILATDPDREGEAISWHIYDVLKEKKIINDDFPVKRISFNSITKKAVKDALDNPRELDFDLVNSQQARRALDYLVGFTLSPILWRKLPGSRSAGRVQSVALRLICERETEIEQFNPQEYWSISAYFENEKGEKIPANLFLSNGEKLDKLSIKNEAEAKQILSEIAKSQFSVSSVKTKQVKRNPKPPFTTSTLQQEASRKLGFSASKTMTIAQKLYEGINIGGEAEGLITYMRTDGVSVAQEAISSTRDYIENELGKKYLPEKPRYYSSKAKNAQEAHEAIRPTKSSRSPKSIAKYLDKDQLKLYDLIWKRLISSQMESAVMDQMSAEILNQDKKIGFRANGNVLVFDGFIKIYKEGVDDKEDEDKESILPEMKEGEEMPLSKKAEGDNPKAEQHFTQPPPRFNEASLVKRLEELGIGRPSTYASIISVLLDRGYVSLDKRRFTAEPRGRIVTSFLEEYFKKYIEYDFTANMEEELDLISAGKVNWKESLNNFWQDFKANIDKASDIQITEVIDHLDKKLEPLLFNIGPDDSEKEKQAKRKCPSCKDGTLNLKLGKFGPFIGCSNYPECKHTAKLDGSNDDNNDDSADGGQKAQQFETKILGTDDDTGKEITLRKGPYGFYIQLGEQEGKNKPKRSGLPKGHKPEDINLEKAKQLLSLPLTLGKHSEDGEDITVGIGRYGPFIAHNKKYYSIKADQIFAIDSSEAEQIIAEQIKEKANKADKKSKKSKK